MSNILRNRIGLLIIVFWAVLITLCVVHNGCWTPMQEEIRDVQLADGNCLQSAIKIAAIHDKYGRIAYISIAYDPFHEGWHAYVRDGNSNLIEPTKDGAFAEPMFEFCYETDMSAVQNDCVVYVFNKREQIIIKFSCYADSTYEIHFGKERVKTLLESGSLCKEAEEE